MFAEKLNFLMSIIGISGGELAHAVSLDPSYISRLRSGKRALPKGQRFLDDIAAYFAARVHTDYQIKLLSEAMEFDDDWPGDIEGAKCLISDWLLTEEESQRAAIMNVLQGAVSSFLLDAVLSPDCNPDLGRFGSEMRDYYYGDSGKRDAFLHFLSAALRAPAGQDMYLFTNESVDWLSTDSDFTGNVAALLTQFAEKNRRVKITHPIQSTATEMIHRLQRWTPVYLTGYAEPYYYPKVRTDFYLRTIFVVPKTVAMISSALEGSGAESIAMVVTDPRAVDSIALEMEHLVSLSTPLASVFTPNSHEGIQETLQEFYRAPGAMLVIHDHLAPFPDIPNDVGKQSQGGVDLEHFAVISSIVRSSSLTEVISKPNVDMIRAGAIPIQLTEVAQDGPRYLTKEEYIKNLEYTIHLLKHSRNYNLLIVPQTFFNFYLCIKKDIGVLISKPEKNAATFFVQQSNVLDIVWEYATAVMKRVERTDKASALAELKDLLAGLKI